MDAELRKQRIWDVNDLAQHLGIHFMKARRLLLRLNKKHGGTLLTPSEGKNRQYTFRPAQLAKLEPSLFESMEDLKPRLDELEEQVGQNTADVRRTARQVGANTRQIATVLTEQHAVIAKLKRENARLNGELAKIHANRAAPPCSYCGRIPRGRRRPRPDANVTNVTNGANGAQGAQ